MISLLYFLVGYCRIVLSGKQQERFLNLCASKNILLWNIKKEEEHSYFNVSRKAYPEFEEIAAKTACTYQCIGRFGLPYFFWKYRKRKLLLLMLVMTGIAFVILSGFVWQIEYKGCGVHSEEEMQDFLKRSGVKIGSRKSQISCAELEEAIREKYPDIAWVSCRLSGTLLQLNWKETIPLKEQTAKERKEPCNIVAHKDGVIDSIVVRSGVAMVKKGDHVKAGDVLISGIVALRDESGEATEVVTVAADGDIEAIVKVPYESNEEYIQYKKKYIKKTIGAVVFSVGEKVIPLLQSENRREQTDDYTKQYSLNIFGKWFFPFSFYVTTQKEYDIKKKCLTKKEASQVQKERLSAVFAEYEVKGVAILMNDVKIYCDEQKCIAKGNIWLKESFGKIQKISRKEKQSDDEKK